MPHSQKSPRDSPEPPKASRSSGNAKECQHELQSRASKKINSKSLSVSSTLTIRKKTLGQFYTTNYAYILQNFSIDKNVINIIEPFAGNGDLLNFINKVADRDRDSSGRPHVPSRRGPSTLSCYNIECYDIDPKKDFIVFRDTLLNPPSFTNKFVITNPPYLARNKCKDKTIFDTYKCNDLYKCFINILIQTPCLGGIIIVPLNFFSSIRRSDIDLRKRFVVQYNIICVNIFDEQVFSDTKYSVCSFQFRLRDNDASTSGSEAISTDRVSTQSVCFIYPSNKVLSFTLDENNNYTIGGEIYNLNKNSNYSVGRATKLTKKKECITNILVKCIDDGIGNKINLSIVDEADIYIDTTPNLSARSYASLVIDPKIDMERQKILVHKFNDYLTKHRNKYHSLFLTNYRESTTIARKRISFKLVFCICNYLLHNII